jgi:uncharacterized protein (TIGR00255 family)
VTLASMTGFARVEGQDEAESWAWEIRSVNGRGLDVRLRMPPGFEALEPPARTAVSGRFARGNVAATLTLSRVARAPSLAINEAALRQIIELARTLRSEPGLSPEPPRLEALLGLRGVLEVAEGTEAPEQQEARRAAVLADFERALDALAAMRHAEGERLRGIFVAVLVAIRALVGEAGQSAGAQPAAIRERLEGQLRELLGAEPPLPEERLAQEVALLAGKADVREELDRLLAHVDAAEALLAAGGPIGRKLDFLCQELNREANTLCAKSADIGLTRIGMDLKVEIDRLREQVQNLE